MSEDTQYWRTSTRNNSTQQKRVHTDRDCDRLDPAVEVMPAEEWHAEHWGVCEFCTDDVDYPETHDYSYQRALRRAATDD